MAGGNLRSGVLATAIELSFRGDLSPRNLFLRQAAFFL
jgi:hypothetical protein